MAVNSKKNLKVKKRNLSLVNLNLSK